jgi:hypothetical protein
MAVVGSQHQERVAVGVLDVDVEAALHHLLQVVCLTLAGQVHGHAYDGLGLFC